VNAKEINTENLKLKVLIYGKSGTGKTTFACSFPKPFIFDFDNGMLSQRGKDVEYEIYKDEVENGVNKRSGWKDFSDKLNELEKQPLYDTLVVDSITTLEDSLMADTCRLNKRTIPTLAEWLIVMNKLEDTFSRMTKIAKHVVFTAHEMTIQDELTSEVWILPLIVGKKLPGKVGLWFDECYRAQMGKDKSGNTCSQVITTADFRYTAKSRLDVLLPLEENLTYDKIMLKLKGDKLHDRK
jgi:phage nucleotide-binding protein